MGHNEDGSLVDIADGYMVNATLKDGENFLSYCYPGELCGNAFSFSFVTQTALTVNSLFPKTVDTNSVGKSCLKLTVQTYGHNKSMMFHVFA